MLDAASGPDQTEIQDRFIAVILESFVSFPQACMTPAGSSW
jgi:hypothetical protein